VLGDHGISEGAAERRHSEALLQERESHGLALLGLLQKSEPEHKGGHLQGHVQRPDHQPGCRIAVATG